MTITELIADFRARSGDTASPYMWTDTRVLGLFNEAVDEACTRKDLIFDATTAAVCQVTVEGDTATYDIHSSIVYATKAYLKDSGGSYLYLDILERDELDRVSPTWREDTGEPSTIIIDETTCQLHPVPVDDYTMYLEVYRTPLSTEKMVLPGEEEDPVSPAIAGAHHVHLIDWALHVAYSDEDADTYDPKKAERHEKKFDAYFGLNPGARRRRDTRANRPHHNKLW